MENEQGGGCRDLFFRVATKKQEVMGGKQWDLVDVGKKKAEDWVKPLDSTCVESATVSYGTLIQCFI